MTGSRLGRTALLTLPYVVMAALVGIALALPHQGGAQTVMTAIVFLVLELLGLAFSVRAATHPAFSPAERRPWRYAAAAFGLLIVSGIGFAVAGRPDPNAAGAGAADLIGAAARLAYIVLLLRAMLLIAVPRHPTRLQRWTLGLDTATVLAVGAMLMWYFLIGPAIAAAPGQSAVLWQAPVVYAVGDLLIVFAISATLLRGGAIASRRPLVLILAAAVASLIADVVLSHLSVTAPDAILYGTVWFTIGVPVALALLVAAAVEQCRLAGRVRAQPEWQLIRRPAWLPYAALGVGFALLALAAIDSRSFPWWGLVTGAILMSAAVAARQIVALRENHHLVTTDNLTGLASRLHLRDTLRGVGRRGRPDTAMAVLQLDLDGFKRINDVYGHETGDQYLVAFANVLRAATREEDLVARLGGDEFAIVLNGVIGPDQAVTVAERIRERIQEPIEVGDRMMRMNASIGIAIAATEALDVEDVLHRADQAMYVAKRRQTHGWQLYADGTMEDDSDAMRRLVAAATGAGQLRVMYQPIVAMDSGDLVAVEALVRWQHPTRGEVSPLEFIPLAEEIGAIHEIGQWVANEATRQLAAWQRRLPPDRRLMLGVNFSPYQLERDTIAEEVLATLRRHGVAPTDFVVEVTEGAVVEDGASIAQLEALRSHGVHVALDDFGTGYSSLRYLTRLPVDILKLDRCFVGELNGQPEGSAIAEAVHSLAQVLHLDTIAEGIENREQATELTLHGYRMAQGFHFSRPLLPERVDGLIDAAGGRWPNLTPDPRGHTGSRREMIG